MNNNVEKVDITSGDKTEHLARALKSIRDGYVIVVPLEHGYVYACDAFSHFAVRAMHVLRGDALGVVAQVIIPNAKTEALENAPPVKSARISPRSRRRSRFRT